MIIDKHLLCVIKICKSHSYFFIVIIGKYYSFSEKRAIILDV